MLNDEICKLRERLNESIIEGEDYNITYELSVKLDNLIAEYYKDTAVNDKNKKKHTIQKNVLYA